MGNKPTATSIENNGLAEIRQSIEGFKEQIDNSRDMYQGFRSDEAKALEDNAKLNLQSKQESKGLNQSKRGSKGLSQSKRGSKGLSESKRGSQGLSESKRESQGISHSKRGSKGLSESKRGSQGLSESKRGSQGISHSKRGSKGLSESKRGSQGLSESKRESQGISHSKRGSKGLSESKRGSQGLSESKRESQGISHSKRGSKGLSESKRGSQGLSESKRESQGISHSKRGSKGLSESKRGSQGLSESKRGSQGISHSKRGSKGLSESKRGSQGLSESKRGSQGISHHSKRGSKGLSESKRGSQGLSESKRESQGISHSKRGSKGLSESKRGSQGLSESKRESQGISHSKRGSKGLSESKRGSQGLSESKRGSQGISHSKRGSKGLSESKRGSQGLSESKRGSQGISHHSKRGSKGLSESKRGSQGISHSKRGSKSISQSKRVIASQGLSHSLATQLQNFIDFLWRDNSICKTFTELQLRQRCGVYAMNYGCPVKCRHTKKELQEEEAQRIADSANVKPIPYRTQTQDVSEQPIPLDASSLDKLYRVIPRFDHNKLRQGIQRFVQSIVDEDVAVDKYLRYGSKEGEDDVYVYKPEYKNTQTNHFNALMKSENINTFGQVSSGENVHPGVITTTTTIQPSSNYIIMLESALATEYNFKNVKTTTIVHKKGPSNAMCGSHNKPVTFFDNNNKAQCQDDESLNKEIREQFLRVTNLHTHLKPTDSEDFDISEARQRRILLWTEDMIDSSHATETRMFPCGVRINSQVEVDSDASSQTKFMHTLLEIILTVHPVFKITPLAQLRGITDDMLKDHQVREYAEQAKNAIKERMTPYDSELSHRITLEGLLDLSRSVYGIMETRPHSFVFMPDAMHHAVGGGSSKDTRTYVASADISHFYSHD